MYLPRFTRSSFVLLACVFICSGTTSILDAQSTSRSAPGTYKTRNRAISSRYQPRFMQAGLIQEEQSNGQQAINNGNVVQRENIEAINNGQIIGAPAGEVIIADGAYFDGGYTEGGFVDSGCNNCGSCGEGGCGPLYDPRDCGISEDCWFGGLGKIFCNTEYFSGVQAFKHQVFADPQGLPSPENNSFGYHFGFNSGLPLYNLTCGVVSGQFGVNWVRSNLNDGVLVTGQREQTFITTGLFRRVDYGLQFGAVADFLNSDYVSELEIVQIRSELSWVWAGGSNFGFRFNKNVQDDSVLIGGGFLPATNVETIDTYRLFYRIACCNGGYAEWYYGRSDEQHDIFGGDYDLPLTQRTALYAAFNYLSPDDELRLTDNEAWNLQIGLTYRPRGCDWYEFYHRPLFKVADNGILIQSRRP